MDLERRFEVRVDAAIREMANIGYVPRVFIDMRACHGTVAAIQRLLRGDEVQYGFTHLWKHGRLDLSMECIINEAEWQALFTEEDRKIATDRLEKYQLTRITIGANVDVEVFSAGFVKVYTSMGRQAGTYLSGDGGVTWNKQ